MRRTNIMLEFSDEVYDVLVEPMKKNKSFSKLLASLVEGYLNDGYIRAYADDTLEDMRRAAVDSFSASIDSMSESLSNMGLFTDELESTSLSGKTKFKQKAEQQAEEIKKGGYSKPEISSTDIEVLSKRIDDMGFLLDERLNKMCDMISNILEKGIVDSVSNSAPESKNIAEVVNTSQTSDVENVKTFVENVEKPNSDSTKQSVSEEVVPDYNTDVDTTVNEDVQEANDFLESMLIGNAFEF